VVVKHGVGRAHRPQLRDSGKVSQVQAMYCPRYSVFNLAPSARSYAHTRSGNVDMTLPRTPTIKCEAHMPSTAVTDTPKAESSEER